VKKFLMLAIIGALTMLAFPGHNQVADAQGNPVANPPMSTNPEIAALQAQTAVLQKQLGILNQKMDQILAKLQQPVPSPPGATSTPVAEPVPPPTPTPPPQPMVRYDGTISFMGNTYVPLSAAGACAPAQTTVSLTADACGSGGAAAGDYAAGACGASSGQRQFRTPIRTLFRRIFRGRGAGGGCGG
jgi:hypothetical protein